MKKRNQNKKRKSGLVAHAKRELTQAGLFDKNSDYNGMIGKAVLELVETFSRQGHSGFSAAMTTDILSRLLKYELLTTLKNPIKTGEYIDVGHFYDDRSGLILQSTRKFSVFSNDGGVRWHDIDKADWKNHIVKFIYRNLPVRFFKVKSNWWHSRCFQKVKFND